MFVCWVMCYQRSLRRADHSSRGVLPTVGRHRVWSRNLVNEKAPSPTGGWRAKNKQYVIKLGVRDEGTVHLLHNSSRMWVPLSNKHNLQLMLPYCMYCWHSWSRIQGILSSALTLNSAFQEIYSICFFFENNFNIISCDTCYTLRIYFCCILREAEKFDSCCTWSAAWSILSRIKQWRSVLTHISAFIEVFFFLVSFLRRMAYRTGRDRNYLHMLSPTYNRGKS